MISKQTLLNLLKFFAFMAVCVVIVSAALFHYVPPEDVKKTVVYAARDLMTPGDDIVFVYPSLSAWNGPERFN